VIAKAFNQAATLPHASSNGYTLVFSRFKV